MWEQKPSLEHKRNRAKSSDHCLDRRTAPAASRRACRDRRYWIPRISRFRRVHSPTTAPVDRTAARPRERFPTGLISNVRVPSELAFSALELYKNGAKKFNVNRGEGACCSKPGAVAKRFVSGSGMTRFGVANIASVRASCASLCESLDAVAQKVGSADRSK